MRVRVWLLALVMSGTAAADPLPRDADLTVCKVEPLRQPARNVPRLRGQTRAQVVARIGAPVCRAADGRWVFWIPHGCTDRRTVIVVSWRKGRAAAVAAWTQYTGEECAEIN